MARQTLSDKSVRRYARAAGLPIIGITYRGGAPGHWAAFVTAGHRHGHIRLGFFHPPQWEWDPPPVIHWSSCLERWPGAVADPAGHLLWPGETCPACG